MKAVWQIMLGTVLAVWEFVHPNHGFWQRQVKYHDYTSSGFASSVNVVAAMIYIASVLLVGFGLQRLLWSKADLRP